MKKINKKAFTFVELIVVVVILWILATIWFSSYSNSLPNTRDAKRKSDFALISSAMKSYKLNKWSYPIPANYFPITYSWTSDNETVAWQGKLTKDMGLSTLDKIPYDPKLEKEYTYSFTKNRQEYEIAGTLENGDNPIALLVGSYKSVAKDILPTIIVATGSTIDVKNTNNLFVFDKLDHNLLYNFEWEENISDGTSLSDLLKEAKQENSFYQNSSFETCEEIRDWGKYIGSWTYQIRSNTGALTDTGCNL